MKKEIAMRKIIKGWHNNYVSIIVTLVDYQVIHACTYTNWVSQAMPFSLN